MKAGDKPKKPATAPGPTAKVPQGMMRGSAGKMQSAGPTYPRAKKM